MQTLVQNNMVVGVIPPASYSTEASIIHTGAITRYVSLKNYRKATFILNVGACSDATVQFALYQSKAPGTAPTNSSISTTALAMTRFWTNNASPDGVFVRTAAASSVMAVNSTNNCTYVVDIDAAALTVASSYDCVGLAVVSGTITGTAFFSATAILSHPRYAKDALPAANV